SSAIRSWQPLRSRLRSPSSKPRGKGKLKPLRTETMRLQNGRIRTLPGDSRGSACSNLCPTRTDHPEGHISLQHYASVSARLPVLLGERIVLEPGGGGRRFSSAAERQFF